METQLYHHATIKLGRFSNKAPKMSIPHVRAHGEDENILCLNVGGVLFHTTADTLKKCQYFKLVIDDAEIKNLKCFIDRDPLHFRYILNYLRGCLVLPTSYCELLELQQEADYFCLTDLVQLIRDALNALDQEREQKKKDIIAGLLIDLNTTLQIATTRLNGRS